MTPSARPQVEPPPGWTADEQFGAFRLEHRYPRGQAIGVFGFALVWFAFLNFILGPQLRGGEAMTFILAPIFAAAGLFILYFALVMMVNVMTISLDGGELRLRHAPLPWPGARTLAASDVRQLWVNRHVTLVKGRKQITFEVMVQLADGGAAKLLGGLARSDEALFVEQQLEARLGLRDEAVAGEFDRE